MPAYKRDAGNLTSSSPSGTAYHSPQLARAAQRAQDTAFDYTMQTWDESVDVRIVGHSNRIYEIHAEGKTFMVPTGDYKINNYQNGSALLSCAKDGEKINPTSGKAWVRCAAEILNQVFEQMGLYD